MEDADRQAVRRSGLLDLVTTREALAQGELAAVWSKPPAAWGSRGLRIKESST